MDEGPGATCAGAFVFVVGIVEVGTVMEERSQGTGYLRSHGRTHGYTA